MEVIFHFSMSNAFRAGSVQEDAKRTQLFTGALVARKPMTGAHRRPASHCWEPQQWNCPDCIRHLQFRSTHAHAR